MKKTTGLFLFTAVFLFVCQSYSQSPHFRKHPLPLEFKGVEIFCMFRDMNHFIWLGTSAGLVRFDGSSHKYFVQFQGKENHVNALFQDSRGILWIGYKNGNIGQFMNDNFIKALPGFSKDPIMDFAEDTDGAIWVGTYGQGAAVFGKNDTIKFTRETGLADDYVYALTEDGIGNVYVGTDQGISICSTSTAGAAAVPFNTEHDLPDNIVTTISRDSDGQIWVGTESAGICRIDPTTRLITFRTTEWPYGRVTSILALEGSLWIGTSERGVIELQTKDGSTQSLSDGGEVPPRITDMLKDDEGNIWLAAGAGYVLSGNRMFTFLAPGEVASNSAIQAIFSSRDGRLWFSTNQGVYFIDKGVSRNAKKLELNILKNIQVISIFEDTAGIMWFGTFDKGVIGFHPQTMEVYHLNERDGLINDNVLSIAGSGDDLWFATLGGVSKCTITRSGARINTNFTNYTSESGLGSNYIYKVLVDRIGRVWFATDGKGVTMLSNGEYTNFSLEEGLKSNIVYSVTEDASGRIWVSTANAGIFRFTGNAFQSFTPHNGLRDLAIASIAGEKNGNLLIVSRQGIDVLDPSGGAVFYHGAEFGINQMDPNLNACAYDAEGNIWFGTDQGLVMYNANIPQMNKWPVTRINEVQVFLSKIDSSKNEFAHNENHISFDYIGFWYHDPAEVSYKVKLDGYDREWINSRNHFITYPNLQPGNYTFLVQSSATNHFAGANLTSYRFSIAPPFYRTATFYAISGILLVGGLFVFVKRRESKLKALERLEKEKILFQFEIIKSQVNPHFLFNSFNTLIGVIEESPESAVLYVEKLSDFYRDILMNRERDVISLGSELEMINNYYFLQTKRYRSNFQMVIDVPEEKKKCMIPPLTLQLLAENSIKHNTISVDHPLTLNIFLQGDYIIVKNNLQRKAAYEPSTGIGLNNIMNRFSFLTSKKVRIEKTDSYFAVHVPLLNPDPT